MTDQKKRTILKIDEIPYNDTTKFLIPCFNLTLKSFQEKGFINAYIADKNRDKINDYDIHLYLLFKPTKDKLLLLQNSIVNLEEEDSEKTVYLEDYDYPGGYIVLVLKFPEKYRQDYENFIKGKYSHFSQEIKDLYTKLKATWQLAVCNKDERIRKKNEAKYDLDLSEVEEVHSIISDKDNILDIDLINNI